MIQQYGPPGLVLDGESRSHSNEIVADYLAFAHSGRATSRAWYLIDEGSSYERRWHAKCRTHSDCAVIRHKSRADGWQCPSCGAPSEDAAHVYLECPAHSGRRGALLRRVRQLCTAAAAEGVPLGVPAQAIAWVHTDSPALISLEAVEAGGALRREAMAFYATAQQVRYCAHRGQAGLTQPPQPAPHVDVENGPKAISQAQHITARPTV